MPVELEKLTFYHIPKTGGTTVQRILESMGGKLIRVGIKHEFGLLDIHASPLNYKTNKPSFAFVRHPVEWFRSLYTARKEERFNGTSVWDEFPGDFEFWTTSLINKYSGFYSRMVKEFEGVTFMGKQENLKVDLEMVLDKYVVDYDKTKLENDRWNIGKEKPILTTKMIDLICESEKDVINKYYFRGGFY